MVKSLDKKWKEVLYSFSGFGPNLLMVLMGAFFTDAINPAALPAGSPQAISGTCLIMPVLFPILWMIAKAFDGIIDVPFAAVTDTLSTKWGRRRPAIAVCFVPMVISFALCWLPISQTNQGANTAWIFIWALIFFATYTMCLIAFYGSLSKVCCDEPQRLRVSSFKSFFDTISYCLVYALVPVILHATGLHIDKLVFIMMPLMLTMIIPLFMIKEGAKYGYPENEGLAPEKVGLISSMKLTFGNRVFMRWIVVNCCAFFGLQMFLVGMNTMITGSMGMSGLGMTILNTCAFAPVPICLYLFTKLKNKKGIRFAFQTCLLAFAVSILSFDFASLYFLGENNQTLQYIIGCVGGVIGSWAIGSFFMMPYLVPAQISSVEERITGKNHSAMYFAAQALTTSIAGAVASSLVYENIKMLFISKAASGVQWAANYAEAAAKFGVAENQVFNLGTLIVPLVTCLMCVVGFVLAFRMPKNYTPEIVEKELKKMNIKIDKGALAKNRAVSVLIWIAAFFIPFVGVYVLVRKHKAMRVIADEKGVKLIGNCALVAIVCIILPILLINFVGYILHQCNKDRLINAEYEKLEAEGTATVAVRDVKEPTERGEIVFVQVALSVLSGFLFGFIWLGMLIANIAKIATNSTKLKCIGKWLLGCFVPFAGIYMLLKEHKALKAVADSVGAETIGNSVPYIVFGILLPLLPLNVVGLSLWQCNVNRILDKQAEKNEQTVISEPVTEGNV